MFWRLFKKSKMDMVDFRAVIHERKYQDLFKFVEPCLFDLWPHSSLRSHFELTFRRVDVQNWFPSNSIPLDTILILCPVLSQCILTVFCKGHLVHKWVRFWYWYFIENWSFKSSAASDWLIVYISTSHVCLSIEHWSHL